MIHAFSNVCSALRNRLRQLFLRPIGNPAEGNCLFHALAQAICARRPDDNITHTALRQQVAAFLRQHPEALAADVGATAHTLDGAFNIGVDRVYAGQEALVALATLLRTPLRMLFLNAGTYGEWMVPPEGVDPVDHEPVTIIAYDGNHYEGTIPEGHNGLELPRKLIFI